MITTSDKDYQATKQIMLGQAIMDPDFRKLADFIDDTYGVKTINIIYDTIGNERTPRLNICFEHVSEALSFNESNSCINYDKVKQTKIADKFKQLINEQNSAQAKGILNYLIKLIKPKYKTDNLFVIFSSFEPIAKEEAIESIPQDKVDQLKKELNNKDLWEISRCFSGTTFLVYTDEQLKEYENSKQRDLWTSKYYDLLEPYNEFNYFEREDFFIYLDSKENFDNNYESNWYYYYK